MEPSTQPSAGLPVHEHLRRWARLQPAKPALLWYGRAISFAELDDASDAFAADLQQRGIGKGEAVALFMGNCPQFVMAFLGIQKAGAAASACSALDKEHEIEAQLIDLCARVLVVAEPLLPIVAKVHARTRLEHVFVIRYHDWLPTEPALSLPPDLEASASAVDAVTFDTLNFASVICSGHTTQSVTIDMNDVALIVYTSGSTGTPKGAMLTHANAAYKTAVSAACRRIGLDDMLLSVAPVYHIAGMLMGINVPILAGATSVLLHRFDPVAVLQAIERHRVTTWYSIASMNIAVMQHPATANRDLSTLTTNMVTSFGVIWTEALAADWRALAPNCTSFEAAYGLSETHTCDTYMPVNGIRWGTHGRPVPGTDIRIIDPDSGREAADG